MAPTLRFLGRIAACYLFASSSFALDENWNQATEALGRAGAWRWTPEIVLRHCRIHVPLKASEWQKAHDEWKLRNAALLSEIEEVTEESVPAFAKLLEMTPEQTRAWQMDSATLHVEEAAFWRKDRDEVVALCGSFPNLLLAIERDAQVDAVRMQLQVARSGLKRRGQ